MDNFVNLIRIFAPIITVVISSTISFFVAKHQAKNEIKRLLLSYTREDQQLFNDAFADLMTKTEDYCSFNCLSNKLDAIQANAKLFTIAPEPFHAILKDMDLALRNSNTYEIRKLREKILDLYSNNK